MITLVSNKRWNSKCFVVWVNCGFVPRSGAGSQAETLTGALTSAAAVSTSPSAVQTCRTVNENGMCSAAAELRQASVSVCGSSSWTWGW